MKDNNEQLFELMTKMYGEMQNGFKAVNVRLDKVDARLDKIENTVTRIENDQGNKLKTLFDGYIQNSEKLERIEKEVSRQEEVILRKIK